METSLIERLDRLRYSLIKWITIGWAIWFGGFILKDFIVNKILLGLIVLIGLFGWIMFLVRLIRYKKLGKLINSKSDLKNALNDELMIFNRNKSLAVGYVSLMILTTIFFGLSIFIDIKALVVCEITLYIGVLSILVSSLIYNRS